MYHPFPHIYNHLPKPFTSHLRNYLLTDLQSIYNRFTKSIYIDLPTPCPWIFWSFGPLKLWTSGVLDLWNFEPTVCFFGLLKLWTSETLPKFGIWIFHPELQSSRVQNIDLDIWSFHRDSETLDLRRLEVLGLRIFGSLKFWTSAALDFWCFNICMELNLEVWRFEALNIWTFENLNRRTSEVFDF